MEKKSCCAIGTTRPPGCRRTWAAREGGVGMAYIYQRADGGAGMGPGAKASKQREEGRSKAGGDSQRRRGMRRRGKGEREGEAAQKTFASAPPPPPFLSRFASPFSTPQEKKFFPLSVAERGGGGEGLKGSLKFGVRREGRATIHNFDAQRRATGEERRAALLPPSFLNPPFFLRPSLGLPACTQVVFGTRP